MTLLIAATIIAMGGGQPDYPTVDVNIGGRGQLTIELYPEKAPKTVAHFRKLVRDGFYDGVRFHRVQNNPRPFIVMTGDPFSKTLPLGDPKIGTGGSGSTVPFEKNDLQFVNGTLGLSRDKKDQNSGDSQFFITNGPQRFLEGTYVGFGRVIKGLDVIPKIERGDRIISIREAN
ncbi:MAG: peptidylprolyl isomerase [Fimbriimonadales bacterium]